MESAVTLWRDPIIQEFLVEDEIHKQLKQTQHNDIARRGSVSSDTKIITFGADDPAYHFLPSLDRIMSKGYSPNTADILSLRIPFPHSN